LRAPVCANANCAAPCSTISYPQPGQRRALSGLIRFVSMPELFVCARATSKSSLVR
jgi:hypothetical protein